MRFLWSCRVFINIFISSIILAILPANILFIIIILAKKLYSFYIYMKKVVKHMRVVNGFIVVCDTLYKQCYKLYTGDQEIFK